VVVVVSWNSRFVGSNPAKDSGFLMAIKTSMTSLGREVKPSVPCCKILWHVKNPTSMKKIYFVGKIQWPFVTKFSFATVYTC
jgi:hypothetical protein